MSIFLFLFLLGPLRRGVPNTGEVLSSTALGSSSTPPPQQPWDAFRFVRQSSRFVRLPLVSREVDETISIRPGDTLWQAGETNEMSQGTPFTMAPLDDVVMGGASASNFDASTGQWSGQVTDANNGGFVGIRSTPSFRWNMEACKGVEWTIRRNDNSSQRLRRLKLVLRDSTDFNGITWSTSVDVKKGLNKVRVIFKDQIPARFARRVPNEKFQTNNVVAVQMAYSKFEYDGDLNPNFELGAVNLQLMKLTAI